MRLKIPLWKIVYVAIYTILLGLLFGRHITPILLLALAIVSLLSAVSLRGKPEIVALMWVGICTFGIGGWRAHYVDTQAQRLTSRLGQSIEITGSVVEDPVLSTTGSPRIALSRLYFEGRNVPGRILVSPRDASEIRRSDRITVSGLFSETRGGYLGALYDAEVRAVSQLSKNDQGLIVRDWFSEKVRTVLPEPHASLGIGFLLGARSELPEDLALDLRLVGLTHIVVASGFNLSIMVRFGRTVFQRVSRYSATVSGLALIGGFIAVSGASPSMVRAGLVAALSLVAWYFTRQFMALLLLGLAACITALINPYYVWSDIGWHLSFLAFFGVLVVAPRIEKYFFGDKPSGNIVRSAFVESLSALVMTIPYSLYVFGQFSSVALIANTAVAPLIPIVMILTFLSGLSAAYVPFIDGIVGAVASSMIDLVLWLINFFARLDPGIELDTVPVQIVYLVYIVIISATLYMHKKTRFVENM